MFVCHWCAIRRSQCVIERGEVVNDMQSVSHNCDKLLKFAVYIDSKFTLDYYIWAQQPSCSIGRVQLEVSWVVQRLIEIDGNICFHL